MRPSPTGVIVSGIVALALLSVTVLVLVLGATSVSGPTVVPRPLALAAATATPPTAAVDGLTLFQRKGCIGCHSLNAAGLRSPFGAAPDLSALAQVAGTRRPGLSAEAYVRESVRSPQAYLVPGFVDIQMPALPVNDAELDALVTFLLRRGV